MTENTLGARLRALLKDPPTNRDEYRTVTAAAEAKRKQSVVIQFLDIVRDSVEHYIAAGYKPADTYIPDTAEIYGLLHAHTWYSGTTQDIPAEYRDAWSNFERWCAAQELTVSVDGWRDFRDETAPHFGRIEVTLPDIHNF
jgi:hypothetical protein